MLLPPDDDTSGTGSDAAAAPPPLFGLDDVGAVVPYAEATAPPLPRHPLPSAELLEPLLSPG